ncbi:MAG: DUF3604 domain-containing protein [Nitrospirota bacterium]|nr:DUF3604 domain-containing protein [Nitrospirota bacterium]
MASLLSGSCGVTSENEVQLPFNVCGIVIIYIRYLVSVFIFQAEFTIGGVRARLEGPYNFLVIADHAENLGLVPMIAEKIPIS